MFDAIIIGGGVIGAMCARELTRYRVKVAVAEAADDVCAGAPHGRIVRRAAAEFPHGALRYLIAVIFPVTADMRVDDAVRRHDARRRVDDLLVGEKVGVGRKFVEIDVIFPEGGELHGGSQHGSHVFDVFVQG